MPISYLLNPLTKRNRRQIHTRSYGSRSNRQSKLSDPFDSHYQCNPFAEITQCATKEEIEDDMAAIYVGITAVNTRQPIPIHVVGTRRAERAEKERTERERVNLRVNLRSNSTVSKGPGARARTKAGKAPFETRDEDPSLTNRAANALTNKEETPIQTRPSTRATTNADGPNSKTPVSTMEGTPTSCPRGCSKRTAPGGNEEIWESICLTQPSPEPSAPLAKKLKPDKSTFEFNAENAKRLVQKRLLDYFGPRGRKDLGTK